MWLVVFTLPLPSQAKSVRIGRRSLQRDDLGKRLRTRLRDHEDRDDLGKLSLGLLSEHLTLEFANTN